ncbi:sensor histidine kinase [Brasilonema octagenarum UFV-E1]|uniref:histidine kinase n=2 Tax=Brasilonema TaxID=383614 RepID=A0A856MDS2_9CYAN|nr:MULTISPECIES: HAMP domain-containing sensor histidine kinase [Brasilonema]NMF66832.1 sensor histidine kinase [Brasilonema octagenarum UFV-OR1]QDL07841.1 sensor histidine kinase [Brasilonema sennae CENA114]QDL14201.1 sensor histidine kinase [Brasilonema octagenarum UFV-E1]
MNENWVYLGAGLAIGIAVRGLFAQTKVSSSSSTVLSQDEQHATPILQQQMKQTQLAYYMAREISQFKAGFLARTTHVLRSPLNGLIGLHQLILSNLCDNPEEEREFIAQAHERALKLLKLIDEILSVARVEHGTNKLQIQPLNLSELLQEVHDLTYMLAENRNFPFQVLPPNPETYILADPYWLRQVLVTLVESCIAQMEEGSICISAHVGHTSDHVHLWLDVPTHATSLNEPIDFMTSKNNSPEADKKNDILLPGMKLLLNQTLLEVMGGKLEVVPSPALEEQASDVTRLQVSIPLVIPEVEHLH